MSNKSRSSLGTIVGVILGSAAITFATLVIINRQYVLDQLTVWNYEPTSQVTSIAQRSTMSAKGKFYFYSSRPTIDTASEFNDHCARQEKDSAILGCYSQQRIYVYDVPSLELDGVEEVTASHETLHAIWDRMSADEKKTISSLLEEAFSKINDPKLNDRMAYYERTEPGERMNELHSILGTEYLNLGDALEAHYKQYFNDRSKVVALHDKYQAIFDGLKAQANTLATELAALKTSIDTKSTQYNNEAASISTESTDLKNSADSVDRTSAAQVNAYNAKRQSLLNRLDALEILRSQINAETQSYNVKVAQYNKIVVSTNDLNKSLDSTLAPAPSI